MSNSLPLVRGASPRLTPRAESIAKTSMAAAFKAKSRAKRWRARSKARNRVIKSDSKFKFENNAAQFFAAETNDMDKFSGIEYQQDGDKSFDSAQNLRKRENLKQDAGVRHSIRKFQDLCSAMEGGSSVTSKRTYTAMHCCMQKTLLTPFDKQTGLSLATEEFEADLRRNGNTLAELSERNLFEALFEIADLWTLDIKSASYVHFLNLLYHYITTSSGALKDLSDIQFYKTLPDVQRRALEPGALYRVGQAVWLEGDDDPPKGGEEDPDCVVVDGKPWYKAVVTAHHSDDGSFDVVTETGREVSVRVPASRLRDRGPFRVGMAVYALQHKAWRRAEVSEVRPDQLVGVTFMDDEEGGSVLLKESQVRCLGTFLSGEAAGVRLADGRHVVGQVVDAGSGFSFSVELEDGTLVENLSRSALHVLGVSETLSYYKAKAVNANMMPLSTAAKCGDERAVNVLLQSGSNPNEVDKMLSTPLIHTVWGSNLSVVKLLLDNGARINHQNLRKNTALHFAYMKGHRQCCLYLLEHGAQQLKNLRGKRPKRLNRELHRALQEQKSGLRSMAIKNYIAAQQQAKLALPSVVASSNIEDIFGTTKSKRKKSGKGKKHSKQAKKNNGKMSVDDLFRNQDRLRMVALSAFEQFDHDASQVLDKKEFLECMKSLSNEPSVRRLKKKVKAYWLQCNTDLYHGISFTEFVEFLNRYATTDGIKGVKIF